MNASTRFRSPLGGRIVAGVKKLFGGARPQHRIAICAVVKNEAPYLLEWVAFHRALGVEHFFIADNDSDDGTSEILAAMEQAGLVTAFHFPTPATGAPQLGAYAEILDRYASRAEWLAFLDADEFLLPASPSFSLVDMLAAMPGSVGTVAVNWAIYGSSGRLAPGSGPVTRRFTRRAKEETTVNHHYKSIVRSAAIRTIAPNPHLFLMSWGYTSVHCDGSPLADHPARGIGLSGEVRWQPMRLNHYVVKSLAEFDHKKAARGRAMSLTAKRNRRFFKAHDQNDILDPMPDWLLAAAEESAASVRALLAQAGCGEDIVNADRRVEALRPADPVPCGCLETIMVGKLSVVLTGWALDHEGMAPARFTVEMLGERVETFKGKRLPRPDIADRHPGGVTDCGFSARIALPVLSGRSGDQERPTPEELSTLRIWADGRYVLDMSDGVRKTLGTDQNPVEMVAVGPDVRDESGGKDEARQ